MHHHLDPLHYVSAQSCLHESVREDSRQSSLLCVAADSLSQPLNLLPACIIYTLTFLCWCLPQHLEHRSRRTGGGGGEGGRVGMDHPGVSVSPTCPLTAGLHVNQSTNLLAKLEEFHYEWKDGSRAYKKAKSAHYSSLIEEK